MFDLTRNGCLECAVRQAAVIYFKHMIQDHWELDDDEKKDAQPLTEEDKIPIRENIFAAIIDSPEPIRLVLHNHCLASFIIVNRCY